MAGKFHIDYSAYNTSGSKPAVFPNKRLEAYQEGWRAKKGGALQTTNPHPAWQSTITTSDYAAWDKGWTDCNAGYPPTHVGAGY